MNVAAMRDMFGHLVGLVSGAIARLLAGGAGDNTPIYTTESDARELAVPMTVESSGVIVLASAVLAEAATLTVVTSLQHTDDVDFNTPANITTVTLGTITLTGGAGGSTELDGALYAFNPTALHNRHRIRVTPNLSAADTDTAEVSVAQIVGGISHPV